MWAGSKRVGGVGWRTVPYEMAIERIFDNDEDRAAPIVPDDNAKAAVVSLEQGPILSGPLRTGRISS